MESRPSGNYSFIFWLLPFFYSHKEKGAFGRWCGQLSVSQIWVICAMGVGPSQDELRRCSNTDTALRSRQVQLVSCHAGPEPINHPDLWWLCVCSPPGLSGCVSMEGGRGEISYLNASQIQLGSSKSTQVVPIELNMWKYFSGSSQISKGLFWTLI